MRHDLAVSGVARVVKADVDEYVVDSVPNEWSGKGVGVPSCSRDVYGGGSHHSSWVGRTQESRRQGRG